MFKKVLIAEDMDMVNHAIIGVLKSLGINEMDHAQYCDEAYLKAKKAAMNSAQFDLVICDLSFKKDYRNENISSGEELASKLKSEINGTKIIINTVEDHPNVIKRIWKNGVADAYVCKDRQGLKSLTTAILELDKGNRYISPSIADSLSQKESIELSSYEITILQHLANGLNQDEIHHQLKSHNIRPNSKSSIEKKLRDLREDLGAKTNPHLIKILTEFQLI